MSFIEGHNLSREANFIIPEIIPFKEAEKVPHYLPI